MFELQHGRTQNKAAADLLINHAGSASSPLDESLAMLWWDETAAEPEVYNTLRYVTSTVRCLCRYKYSNKNSTGASTDVSRLR